MPTDFVRFLLFPKYKLNLYAVFSIETFVRRVPSELLGFRED
jgi:hypothetical protein